MQQLGCFACYNPDVASTAALPNTMADTSSSSLLFMAVHRDKFCKPTRRRIDICVKVHSQAVTPQLLAAYTQSGGGASRKALLQCLQRLEGAAPAAALYPVLVEMRSDRGGSGASHFNDPFPSMQH